jgi:hypothetical protein
MGKYPKIKEIASIAADSIERALAVLDSNNIEEFLKTLQPLYPPDVALKDLVRPDLLEIAAAGIAEYMNQTPSKFPYLDKAFSYPFSVEDDGLRREFEVMIASVVVSVSVIGMVVAKGGNGPLSDADKKIGSSLVARFGDMAMSFAVQYARSYIPDEYAALQVEYVEKKLRGEGIVP